MTKLIVVTGATGTQGASVVDSFLKESGWKIRGITRDPSKASSKALADKGVEVVQGDLADIESLKKAFQGANVIFGTTDFFSSAPAWKPDSGKTLNEFLYDQELQQAKNIADAAATVVDSSLELYVQSTLSAAKKWSRGKYTWVYHFDSKAAATDYVKEQLPALAKKTSYLQVGMYSSNWKTFPTMVPQKQPDGVYKFLMPGSLDKPYPLVDAHKDTGSFVKALTQLPPGQHLLGAGEMMTLRDYFTLWAEITGVKARLEVTDLDSYEKIYPNPLTKEIGEMFEYASEFGYDGSDPANALPKDLGVPCPTTSMADNIKSEDWTTVL
ncbi:MAG: hypothetical protein M1817_002064 [Caeruleum heppii]|nr:MAG: hypothetical protein M1817_002064 [Caeruleum heppii]